ncbi:DUF6292 family protein [Streptomyces sp. NPDC056987]|uniref:DUF6292 family protein n=1 Tax=Streptomyces sp. NPDC056987 TaxID=3345988 RepID=UPI003641E27C
MIRAGRQHLVRTLADLARAEGVSLGTYKNKKLHRRPGFPAPISSPSARVLLWDGEQHDAYLAGKPIPPLPSHDDPDDLLDRSEAPLILRRPVSALSWKEYKRADPKLSKHVVVCAGVDHHRRKTIIEWDRDRVGEGHGGGRPVGTGDLMPREELKPRTAQLLAADPAITAEQVGESLGVHEDTAQRALMALRTERVATLLTSRASLTAEEVADTTGYPLRAARRALATAQAQQRAVSAAPYVAGITDALHAAGLSTPGTAEVTVRPGAVCAALVVVLDEGLDSLLWDERYGWRTAPDTRITAEPEPPAGPGIRYLARGVRPEPADVVSALRDRRIGTKRPRTD